MSSLLQMLASIFRLLTLESFGPKDLCCPKAKKQLHSILIHMQMYLPFKNVFVFMDVCVYIFFQLEIH